MKTFYFCSVVVSLGLAGMLAAQDQSPVVKVGLIDTLFTGSDTVKEEKAMIAETQPFADLLEKRTKLKGEFVLVHGMPEMIREFQNHKIQMAVLHGVEYGWLRDKCRDCKPLLIAVQDTPTLKAEVLVSRDSPARTLADLKGKRLAAPKRPQPHTLFYLERSVHQEPDKYFQKETLNNTEAAIEAVVEGNADFTVIGNAQWDLYQDQKPGRAKRLKVIDQSPEFPATVIVYDELESNEDTLAKFRENLLTAEKSPEGRQALNLWRVSSFQETPKDYERQVDAIVQRYPAEEK